MQSNQLAPIILLVRMEEIMNHLATTKLSSKGQVVIPEEIRNQLNLHPGDQFIVVAEKDVVISFAYLLSRFSFILNMKPPKEENEN